jgi:hypothetical protein
MIDLNLVSYTWNSAPGNLLRWSQYNFSTSRCLSRSSWSATFVSYNKVMIYYLMHFIVMCINQGGNHFHSSRLGSYVVHLRGHILDNDLLHSGVILIPIVHSFGVFGSWPFDSAFNIPHNIAIDKDALNVLFPLMPIVIV